MVCVKLRKEITFIEYSVPDTGTGGDALFRLSHLSLPMDLEMSVKIDSRW